MEDTGSAWVTCPIWGTPCEKIEQVALDDWMVNSSRAGGKYIIAGGAYREATALEELSKMKLSRWIYEQNQLGEPLKIDTNTLEKVKTRPMPSVPEQMDYCLQFLESKTEALGGAVDMVSCSDEIQAATLLKDDDEILYLMQQSRDIGWIWLSIDGCDVKILSEGYQRLEELKKTNVTSVQAFVAIWFDSSTDEVWKKGLEPGIQDAGYKALRIDRIESNDKIDDEIIAEIKRSRFVVADFTSDSPENARGSVYYEAGFAHGLNIPVIFTCRKDLLEDIHFDTRQYNHIAWEEEKPEDLRKRLTNRISATIGDGPYRNKNPQQ